MRSRESAMGVIKASLEYEEHKVLSGNYDGVGSPLIFILQHDERDPHTKVKSIAYLYALRWLIVHSKGNEFLDTIQELLLLPFPMRVLIKCFDTDMEHTNTTNMKDFDSISQSVYTQVLEVLLDPRNRNYNDADRDLLVQFLRLWINFPSAPHYPTHSARIITYVFPLLRFLEFPAEYLEQVGEMDRYAEEIRWLAAQGITQQLYFEWVPDDDDDAPPIFAPPVDNLTDRFRMLWQVGQYFTNPNNTFAYKKALSDAAVAGDVIPRREITAMVMQKDPAIDRSFAEMYQVATPIYWKHRQLGMLDKTNIATLVDELRNLPPLGVGASRHLQDLIERIQNIFAR